ncbi:phage major capsid protein [Paludisphaera mucosa]|uniref:Phage major capsid protein n=1 Tax=Paludisphaera mucosa TaxID=3030827 RepID=A0ABT6F6M4_9BACT|nr:phage major capsid protein [Paludisphaera mucosa]MDG3003240.1 phage major capsid protein [Paludisphaera mucosa]
MTPDQIQALRDQIASKSTELSRLVNADAPTGADLTKAEKLHEEIAKARLDVKGATEDARRHAALRLSAKDAQEWLAAPAGDAPFSGRQPAAGEAGRVEVKGFEEAGHGRYRRDKGGDVLCLEEVGPGQFGVKKWELFQSFEYKKDFTQYLRKGNRAIDDVRFKTLVEGIDDQGGVFAPAEMIQRIIGREPAPTQLRGLVQSITTGRDVVEMPRKQYSADDKYTTAFRPTWTGEIPSDGTGALHLVDDKNLLGSIQIPVHTAMLSAPLSKNLIEDSAFPVQSWLENELGQVIDLLYEDMILNGNGVFQPTGILLGAASANNGTTVRPDLPEVVLSGSAGALSYDGLDDLQTALAAQYENENTRWVMNKKSTLRAIRKLKDSNNRPLFTTGAADYGITGARGRVLLGDPIVVSAFAPNVGAGAFPVVYGDLRGYYLAQRIGFSIQVLDQTRARANQIELVGRVRFGGKPVEPFRLKIGKSDNS